MPITATIRSVTTVGDGCSVLAEFSDGSSQQFDFQTVPSNGEVRQRIKAEVARRNTIDDQVNRLQNLVGVTIS